MSVVAGKPDRIKSETNQTAILKQTGWRVLGAHVLCRGGGGVVVNAINTLEKWDVLEEANTNFLSTVCVRVKLVAAVLEEKTQQQQKKLMQMSKTCL